MNQFDYDFDKLYKENSDNILGMFIEKIRGNSKDDDVARKALHRNRGSLVPRKSREGQAVMLLTRLKLDYFGKPGMVSVRSRAST